MDLCRNCGSDLSTRKTGRCINADCGLWEGPPDTFLEHAFSLDKGMIVSVSQSRYDLPPQVTVNGRLRLFFDSWETWRSFVAYLDAASLVAETQRHQKRGRLNGTYSL